MALNSDRLLARLRPARGPRRWLWLRPRVALRRIVRWTRKHTWKLVSIGLLLTVWVVAHIYYFNKLVDLEYNVQAAWAQVEAEQQRRFHIQQNVARLVTGYAEHERSLMTRLTELRARAAVSRRDGGEAGGDPASLAEAPESGAGAGEAAAQSGEPPRLVDLSPAELNRIFPQIVFTAEQYPNLRLTENFQQFSTAIVETETRITERIEIYNERVNAYTTALRQFPSNVFGKLWGFDGYAFYVPDSHTVYFHPIQYPLDSRGADQLARDVPAPALAPGFVTAGPSGAVAGGDPEAAPLSGSAAPPVEVADDPDSVDIPPDRGPYRGGAAEPQP